MASELRRSPLGVADIKRAGADVTLIAIAGAVPNAVGAAEDLATEGVSVDVIDPRTLVPLDHDTILASAARTSRLVIADPAHRTRNAASEIAAIAAEEIFESLKVPVVRATTPQTHVPFSSAIEKQVYPTPRAHRHRPLLCDGWRTKFPGESSRKAAAVRHGHAGGDCRPVAEARRRDGCRG